MKNSNWNSRREFVKKASLAGISLSFPFPEIPNFMKGYELGIVVHSYGMRSSGRLQSAEFPAFQDALDFMNHCHEIGARGIQTVVNGWQSDFSKKVREERERKGMYLEGSIGLPKTNEDVARFETDILAAKEAGATVVRSVCLNGRRYENFSSRQEFMDFKKGAIQSLHLAEPTVRKHQIKLAIENHKDWKAAELAEILKQLGSEWVGATVDFGNNVSLIEDPNEVIETLAPYAFSTHIKDMGVQEYEDGFLLSEVPLGEGIVDLKKGMDLCKKYNPQVTFSLEMITRDPLKVPCLTDGYWGTFDNPKARDFARHLAMIKKKSFSGGLQKTSGLTDSEKLNLEEKNVVQCIQWANSQ